MIIIRLNKVFNEIASVEDHVGGFVIVDIEEVEASTGVRVFGVVYDGYVKLFGCFVVCIECE